MTIEKITTLISEMLLGAIIIMVPGYFAFFLKTASVFTLNKVVLFRVLLLLLLLSASIRWVFDHKIFLSLKFKRLLPVFLFFLVIGFIQIFSIDIYQSFWGLTGREQGYLSFTYYLLFFATLLSVTVNKASLRRLLLYVSFSSLVPVLYGYVQFLGFDPITWSEERFRITSTFGQPNFFAQYLLLVIPVTFYFVINSKKFWSRFFWIFLLILQFFNLFFTLSRAAWLGLIVAIFFVFIYFIIYQRRSRQLKLFFIGMALFFIFIFTIFNTSLGSTARLRVISLKNLGQSSVATRIQIWSAAWSAIKERPVFGYGLENQGLAMVKYYESDWAKHTHVHRTPSRAHNILLDIILTTGFFGLALFFALLLFFVRILLRGMSSPDPDIKNINRVIAFSVFSLFCTLQFSFTTVSQDLLLILFLSIVICSQNFRNSQKQDSNHRPLLFFIVFIIVVPLAIIGTRNEFSRIQADYYMNEINTSQVLNQGFFGMVGVYSELEQISGHPYYKYLYLNYLVDWFEGSTKPEVRYIARNELQRLSEHLGPTNYYQWVSLGRAHRALSKEKNDENFEFSKKYFNLAINHSEKYYGNYYELGMLYFKFNEFPVSISNFEIALKKLPNINDRDFISKEHKEIVKVERANIMAKIGLANLLMHNYKEAERYLFLAIEDQPQSTIIYKYIYDLFVLWEKNEDAIRTLKKGVILSPNDYYWYEQLALIYADQGGDKKAIQYANKSLELFKNNINLINFISTLNE